MFQVFWGGWRTDEMRLNCSSRYSWFRSVASRGGRWFANLRDGNSEWNGEDEQYSYPGNECSYNVTLLMLFIERISGLHDAASRSSFSTQISDSEIVINHCCPTYMLITRLDTAFPLFIRVIAIRRRLIYALPYFRSGRARTAGAD